MYGANHAFGWHEDPAAVTLALDEIEALQGVRPVYGEMCEELDDAADDDADVVFWKAEEKIFQKLMESWDQLRVGTCVSFGYGRGADDLIVMMSADGLISWPGAHVATEPIYAGSRVEVGGGRISGDGSVGAWAAQWMEKWGTLLRIKYGAHDLTTYSESRSRDWGRRGCPDDLEPTAKLYPVAKVVLVERAEEAWKLLGNRNPIPVCSNVGFDSPLTEGFCEPRGSWPHCMEMRGRVIARRGTSRALTKAYPIQNSWGNYLRGDAFYVDRNGDRQPLPPGCFLADEEAAARILRERDSFALGDQRGFKPKQKIDWLF